MLVGELRGGAGDEFGGKVRAIASDGVRDVTTR